MSSTQANAIQARRENIRRERAKLEESLAALEAEEKDLEITERTLARLGLGPFSVASAPAPKPHWRTGTPRPEGLPTTRAMISMALADAEGEGKTGLTASELVNAIARKWWPGVAANSIVPEAARAVKAGVFGKAGSLYVRINNKGPDAGASEPLL